MLKINNGDINSLEDRLWAIANTVAIEEHALSSYFRTKDPKWIDVAHGFREMRKRHMEYILGKEATEDPAEIWCMTKHALAAAMRYSEVSARYREDDPEHMKLCLEDCTKCLKLIFSILGTTTEDEASKLQNKLQENRIEDEDLIWESITEPLDGDDFKAMEELLNCCEDKNAPHTETSSDSKPAERQEDGKPSQGFFGKFKDVLLRCCKE